MERRGKSGGKKRVNKDNQKTSQEPANDGAEESSEKMLEKFEQELWWCIQQLELGLAKQKPDSKQAADAVKVLKILSNPKAAMIKKRQAMRNTFGDYRKKMAEEEKKLTNKMQSTQNIKQRDESHSKSKFLRKSSDQSVSTCQTRTESDITGDLMSKLDLNMQNNTEPFRFNFSTNSTLSEKELKSEETVNCAVAEPGEAENSVKSSVNYYKLVPGGQSFTFSFPAPEQSGKNG